MSIKVSTAEVVKSANNIKNINLTIKSDIVDMENSVKNLNYYWVSTASNNAANKFNNIKNTYFESRFKVVNDLVSFMNNYVASGYEKTESTIQSAASYFK